MVKTHFIKRRKAGRQARQCQYIISLVHVQHRVSTITRREAEMKRRGSSSLQHEVASFIFTERDRKRWWRWSGFLVWHGYNFLFPMFGHSSLCLTVLLQRSVNDSWVTMCYITCDMQQAKFNSVTILAMVVSTSQTVFRFFPCGLSCPAAALPGIEGFLSFHTSTSASPTSCPPGPRRSPHLAAPPGITGDSICKRGTTQNNMLKLTGPSVEPWLQSTDL